MRYLRIVKFIETETKGGSQELGKENSGELFHGYIEFRFAA